MPQITEPGLNLAAFRAVDAAGDPQTLVRYLDQAKLQPTLQALWPRMIEQLRLPRPARLLDAGCGLGAEAMELARAGEVDVTGIDSSLAMIEGSRPRHQGSRPRHHRDRAADADRRLRQRLGRPSAAAPAASGGHARRDVIRRGGRPRVLLTLTHGKHPHPRGATAGIEVIRRGGCRAEILFTRRCGSSSCQEPRELQAQTSPTRTAHEVARIIHGPTVECGRTRRRSAG